MNVSASQCTVVERWYVASTEASIVPSSAISMEMNVEISPWLKEPIIEGAGDGDGDGLNVGLVGVGEGPLGLGDGAAVPRRATARRAAATVVVSLRRR